MLRSAQLGVTGRRIWRFAARRLCTSSPLVKVEADSVDSTVKILTLNSPKSLNAMTVALGDAFHNAILSLRDLPPNELRAVVLTGEGRAFSAGGDLSFLEDRRVASPTSNALTMRAFYERFLSVRSLPVPVIACINGPAIGAGLCLAMGTDIRVTHDAAKLGFTFVGLGLHPGMGCTHTIAANAGGQAAARMLLTADVVSGAEAAKVGFVSASLPDADAARAEALGLSRRVAAQSPLAVRATVATLRRAANAGLDAALAREADAQAQSYASADYSEGLAALRGKRSPVFGGAMDP